MANHRAGKSKDPGRREAMRMALTGEWPRRLLRGELVVDDVFIRDVVGLEGEAIPWSARHAVLKRLNHDLAVVSFSGGWGAPQQPDPEEAEFLVQEWHDESDLFVLGLVDGPFSAAAKAWGWEGPWPAWSSLARPSSALWPRPLWSLPSMRNGWQRWAPTAS